MASILDPVFKIIFDISTWKCLTYLSMSVYIADASADKIISTENINIYIYVPGLQLCCPCSYINYFPWVNLVFYFDWILV